MTDAIDNALVAQKDRIRVLINDREYEQALTLLNFVAPLWQAASYGYKEKEVRDFLRAEVRNHLYCCCSHWKQKEKYSLLLGSI